MDENSLKCESCKKVKETTALRACGYDEDVHGEEVLELICDECEHEHLMDI